VVQKTWCLVQFENKNINFTCAQKERKKEKINFLIRSSVRPLKILENQIKTVKKEKKGRS